MKRTILCTVIFRFIGNLGFLATSQKSVFQIANIRRIQLFLFYHYRYVLLEAIIAIIRSIRHIYLSWLPYRNGKNQVLVVLIRLPPIPIVQITLLPLFDHTTTNVTDTPNPTLELD